MGSLFLSYGQDDEYQVRDLAAALQVRGAKVSWDHGGEGGQHFRDHIEAELDRAAHVIVLWSTSSIHSEFVREEAQRAAQCNKYLGVSIGNAKPPVDFCDQPAIVVASIRDSIDAILAALNLPSLSVSGFSVPPPNDLEKDALTAAYPSSPECPFLPAEYCQRDEASDDAERLRASLSADLNDLADDPALSVLDPVLVKAMVESVAPNRRREFTNELKGELAKVKRKGFTILLVGRTGVGKSSTVNSLVGKEVAKINDFQAETSEVSAYDTAVENVNLTIYDTPGLCDDLEEVGNDLRYLDKIRRNVRSIDLMLFLTRLDDTRVSNDEKRGIKTLYEQLGPDIWRHSLIVFTFANKVDKDKFKTKVAKRTELLRTEIGQHADIGADLAKHIPAVCIDNTNPYLLNDESWFEGFYIAAIKRMREKGMLAFRIATEPYINPTPSRSGSGYGGSSSYKTGSDKISGKGQKEIKQITEKATKSFFERASDLVRETYNKVADTVKSVASKIRRWFG